MKTPETPPLAIAPEEAPDEASQAALAEGLGAHAAALGLPGNWTPHWIFARDGDGVAQAGVRYLIVFDWLFVHWLWVADAYRGRGVGSRLLASAEDAARAKGCRGAYLDTFTFQAPKFYQRHGYREFGRLDDFPSGHSRIWFSKRL